MKEVMATKLLAKLVESLGDDGESRWIDCRCIACGVAYWETPPHTADCVFIAARDFLNENGANEQNGR